MTKTNKSTGFNCKFKKWKYAYFNLNLSVFRRIFLNLIFLIIFLKKNRYSFADKLSYLKKKISTIDTGIYSMTSTLFQKYLTMQIQLYMKKI